MPTSSLNSSIVLHNVANDTPSKAIRAWEPLERLARRLSDCEQTEEQVRLMLELVRETTHAESAFWFQETPDGQTRVVADDLLPRPWCESVARDLLAGTDRSRGLGIYASIDRLPAPGGDLPRPSSVAVVRVSRSMAAWLVAISFRPEMPLSENDIKVIRLAKRMFLNHRRYFRLSESLRSTLFGLIQGFTTAIDAKDRYTFGHSERVARIGVRLATEMQLAEELVGDIYLAGLLHDIGKIGIRDRVLLKPATLTHQEHEHIQEHPVIGYRILEGIAQFRHLATAVRNHHERFDGGGYPDALRGQETPLIARVLAVADACDAMRSPRPYRGALPVAEIDRILTAGAGSQWDADIIDRFMACRAQVYDICCRNDAESVSANVERYLATDQPEDSSTE